MAEASTRPPFTNQHSSDNGTNGTAQLKNGSPQIAHTLTACTRCRSRKTRCDPGLPRCGPCERNNQKCEYFDPAKGRKVPRDYVVHLQHRVRDLEEKLAQVEKEDGDPDPEDQLRGAASVRLQEHDESKFLGPSSGVAITRLVMQLAKQFTNSTRIAEIVPEHRAHTIKKQFQEEEEKPTSKVYPLISEFAAEQLPPRELLDQLVQVFLLKVIAMYPFLHEQTLLQDVEDVWSGSTDPYQNFEVRMVIAVSLQRAEAQYAGLADSFYLWALRYLEDTVKPMNVKTIQCFCFFAVYSLLTPTRTAVYYVIGLACRLAQALGLTEEKTIVLGSNGERANPLEIDMRRRVYWSILVMELGLAHSLGRPGCFPMAVEHMNVEFYHPVDDEFITKDGVTPNAPISLKKWISIHFFRMRLLQLKIRRMLYQRKRPEPQDDSDPWFKRMEEELNTWKDASPEGDAGSGLNKAWFVGRHNTMRVFLFRPSPQIPRPSLRAAKECYDACEYNIYMHRDQIESRSVELTWIFTQSIFMAINTILWTLSYAEIRQEHPRDKVKDHLGVALYCIGRASQRWPGAVSAHNLYQHLIDACLQIYDKDGDIPIVAGSPTDSSDNNSHRSTTTSPALQHRALSKDVAVTPPPADTKPFGYLVPPHQQYHPSPSQASSYDYDPTQSSPYSTTLQTPPMPNLDSLSPQSVQTRPSMERASTGSFGSTNFNFEAPFDTNFDPSSQFNPLPGTFGDMAINWNPQFNFSSGGANAMNMTSTAPLFDSGSFADIGLGPHQAPPLQFSDVLYPQTWSQDRGGFGQTQSPGLTREMHDELMQELQTGGAGQLQSMIQAQNALFYPQGRSFQ